MEQRLNLLEGIIFNPSPLVEALLAAGAGTPAQIEAVLRDYAPDLGVEDVSCALRYLRTAALCTSVGIKVAQSTYEAAGGDADEVADYDAVLDLVALAHLWLALDLEVALGAEPMEGHRPDERGHLLGHYVSRLAGAAGSDWLCRLFGDRLASLGAPAEASMGDLQRH